MKMKDKKVFKPEIELVDKAVKELIKKDCVEDETMLYACAHSIGKIDALKRVAKLYDKAIENNESISASFVLERAHIDAEIETLTNASYYNLCKAGGGEIYNSYAASKKEADLIENQ